MTLGPWEGASTRRRPAAPALTTLGLVGSLLLVGCGADETDASSTPAPVDEPNPCPAAYEEGFDASALEGTYAGIPCEGETEATCRREAVEVDGETRCYLVSVPQSESDAPRPLLLAWHGSEQNGASFRETMSAAFTGLDLEAAVGDEALIVYPDGRPHPDCSDDTCWDRDPDGPDVHFFDALVDQLERDWNIDREAVLSFGHSRGGRFTEVLGCYRADAHRGLASSSAGPNNVSECPGQAPMWLAQSELDQTIPMVAGVSHVEDWAERNGCDPVADALSFPRDVCTPLTGCDVPVSWCPTTEDEWEGHAPPDLADTELWAFFSAQLGP